MYPPRHYYICHDYCFDVCRADLTFQQPGRGSHGWNIGRGGHTGLGDVVPRRCCTALLLSIFIVKCNQFIIPLFIH